MVIPSSSAALYPHPSQAESLRQRKCISWCDLIEFSLLPMMSCLWNLPHLSLFLLYFPLFPPPPAFSPCRKLHSFGWWMRTWWLRALGLYHLKKEIFFLPIQTYESYLVFCLPWFGSHATCLHWLGVKWYHDWPGLTQTQSVARHQWVWERQPLPARRSCYQMKGCKTGETKLTGILCGDRVKIRHWLPWFQNLCPSHDLTLILSKGYARVRSFRRQLDCICNDRA